MPCPAFRCDESGAIVCQNAAAERLWGGRPPGDMGRWSGFVALWLEDGTPVDAAVSPAALAAGGADVPPTELLAESLDGESRRVVFHARPLLDTTGRLAGSLCALTDVSERRRLEHQARAVDEDRVVFLTMLAHELRNPLSPIMSAAGAMRKLACDATLARMAEIVERQAKQLARFIADLLNAARLVGAPPVPVAMRDSCVGEVLDLAADVVAGPARARPAPDDRGRGPAGPAALRSGAPRPGAGKCLAQCQRTLATRCGNPPKCADRQRDLPGPRVG